MTKKTNGTISRMSLKFRNWKIKNKIIFGFFIVSFIYSLVSIYVIYYNIYRTEKNNNEMHIIHKLIIHQKEAELLLRDYYFIDDKSQLNKIDIELKRNEFRERINNYEDLKNNKGDDIIISDLKNGSDDFFVLAKEFINLHNARIESEHEFEKYYQIEKDLRYSITDSVLSTKESDIIASYYIFSYKGKEALFQFRDKEHFDDWHSAIEDFDRKINDKNLIKEGLIKEYHLTAEKLEQLVLRIEEIKSNEVKKLSQIKRVEILISQLQNKSDSINMNNSEMLVENLVIYGFFLILLTFLLIIIIGYIVAYYISNPIIKISKFAEQIGKDNYTQRIEINSNDEIGQTAKVLNDTLDKIKESKEILEIKVNARTRRLKNLTDELDNKVKDRTKKLNKNIEELERFNNLAIDRELKMIELKKEIKKLKQGVCTIDKYDLSDDKKREPQNCWEYWNCKKDIRENCESYKTNSGKECWLVASGQCPRSKERGIKDCQNCSWYKIINKSNYLINN
ncbi:MAG: HAMP domain-containing protein [Patescibacteria group bacterium]|nr:HAMP domain-containing protein [Patescibacteria group bacterium]